MGRSRFKETFRERSAEWLLAAGLAGWGFITIISANDSFTRIPNLFSMLTIMSQDAWGTLALVVGSLRLLFLLINGAWRPSAHLRVIGCILSCFTWGMMLISTIAAPTLLPSVALYPVVLCLDFLALWYAARDAKLADLSAKGE